MDSVWHIYVYLRNHYLILLVLDVHLAMMRGEKVPTKNVLPKFWCKMVMNSMVYQSLKKTPSIQHKNQLFGASNECE